MTLRNNLKSEKAKERYDRNFNSVETTFSQKELEEHDKEIRAKAIDEFIKKIREKEEELYEADGGGIYNFSEERAYNNGIIEMSDTIDKIAEEMKKEK